MTFKVTILGTGTSFGVPVIGCDCAVCQSDNPRNNRMRTSILVETETENILVDCGTDFRQQALRANIEHVDRLLMTHTHADHISGIDDLRVYNFRFHKTIPVYCNESTKSDLKERFYYFFDDDAYEARNPKVPLVMKLKLFHEPMEIGGVVITPIKVMHGKLEILGFRFNNFAYITDCKILPEESRRQLEGVETLILNALRHEPHPVHLSLDEAIELAKELNPREVYLTHTTHAFDYDEINAQLAAYSEPKIQMAWDGQTFELD